MLFIKDNKKYVKNYFLNILINIMRSKKIKKPNKIYTEYIRNMEIGKKENPEELAYRLYVAQSRSEFKNKFSPVHRTILTKQREMAEAAAAAAEQQRMAAEQQRMAADIMRWRGQRRSTGDPKIIGPRPPTRKPYSVDLPVSEKDNKRAAIISRSSILRTGGLPSKKRKSPPPNLSSDHPKTKYTKTRSPPRGGGGGGIGITTDGKKSKRKYKSKSKRKYKSKSKRKYKSKKNKKDGVKSSSRSPVNTRSRKLSSRSPVKTRS
jgi:hypothetical protein